MQVHNIQTSPSPRKSTPLVHQLFPQFIGVMRPHVGHSVVCVMQQGIPIVKCADCDQALTGKFYNPRVLECVGRHLGHQLRWETRGNELYISCACGKDVVGSTPF